MCFSTEVIPEAHRAIILLQVYGLPAERIYATYFGGDEKSGLPADIEARDLWLKILPKERVLPFAAKVCSLFVLFFYAVGYSFPL